MAVMQLMPVWSELKAVARTLPYDGANVRDNQGGNPLPASRWASVTIPTLVVDGGKSPAWMRHANRSRATVLPNAQYRTLGGADTYAEPKRTRLCWWSFSKIRSRGVEGRYAS
jgi:hypothetical protein